MSIAVVDIWNYAPKCLAKSISLLAITTFSSVRIFKVHIFESGTPYLFIVNLQGIVKSFAKVAVLMSDLFIERSM